MALILPTYTDPTNNEAATQGWVEVAGFYLSAPNSVIKVDVAIYRSQAAYQAGQRPVSVTTYQFGPSPALRPDGVSLPSFNDLLAQAITTANDPVGTLAFEVVKRTIFAWLATLPEFTGATTS